MRYIKLSLIITMVFFAGPLLAQFQDKVIITVPWGEGSKELGRLQTGQSFWAPAFFALSSDGSVYIPDFYHQRILNFQRDGNYLGSIPIPDLNSRLRYFGFTGNFFVILDDRSVYTYDLLGQKIGSLNDVFLMIRAEIW